MRCIIIDDEPNAIDVLKRYVEETPFLQLGQTFRNPVKAMAYLQENNTDLIFLDINMPNLSGIQFAGALAEKPMIIFTTAYSEHAVQSYELNAIDYLVKPIEFDRFIKAVNKAKQLLDLKKKADNSLPTPPKADDDKNFILLKSGPVTHKVKTADILFVEKEENYLAFYTTEKKILIRANMNEIFGLLPQNKFCRVHKSFVISLDRVSSLEVHQVTIGKHKIPIGHNYRDELLQLIQKK